MTKEDREAVIVTHPNSLKGFATNVTVHFGAIVESIGDEVCSRYFSECSDNPERDMHGPSYIIEVRPVSFKYKYDEFKYATFAVDPMVSVAISITIKKQDGQIVVPEHTYNIRNNDSAGAYIVDFHATRRVNANLHAAIEEIYLNALNQIPNDPTIN
jgi:hypothetical protein